MLPGWTVVTCVAALLYGWLQQPHHLLLAPPLGAAHPHLSLDIPAAPAALYEYGLGISGGETRLAYERCEHLLRAYAACVAFWLVAKDLYRC